MDPWYPAAAPNKAAKTAGRYHEGMPFRGVLHTTESTTFSPRSDSYGGWHQSYPHFTLVERPSGVTIYQHIPIDTAARALLNVRGGVPTNHARAIQIEIVGRARQSAKLSEALIDALARWMRWVEEQAGVRRAAPLPFLGAEAYGAKGAGRMSFEEWMKFDAWCGHQHVPENKHWDPGHININELLRRGVDDGAISAARSVSPAAPMDEDLLYQVVNIELDGLADVYATPAGTKTVFQLADDAAGLRITGNTEIIDGGAWVEIVAGAGSRGWISAHNVAPATGPPPEYEVVGVRQDDVLNVRSGPGPRNDLAGSFQPGARSIVATGEAVDLRGDRWVRVRQTIEGWVNADFLAGTDEDFGVEFGGDLDMDPMSHGEIGDGED